MLAPDAVANPRGKGTIALSPTLTEIGLTIPLSGSPQLSYPFDDNEDDDGDPGAGGALSGMRNVFVATEKLRHEPDHNAGDCL